MSEDKKYYLLPCVFDPENKDLLMMIDECKGVAENQEWSLRRTDPSGAINYVWGKACETTATDNPVVGERFNITFEVLSKVVPNPPNAPQVLHSFTPRGRLESLELYFKKNIPKKHHEEVLELICRENEELNKRDGRMTYMGNKYFERLDSIKDIQEQYSERGKNAIATKLSKDTNGQQAAKKDIHLCWLAWQDDSKQYRSIKQFANEMEDKHGEKVITARTIKGWCTKWKKEKSAPTK